MNYHLSFLDDAGHVLDVWEAAFQSEHGAICWMWIAGGVWAQHSEWSTMALSCRRCYAGGTPCPRTPSANGDCCIARVPARALRPAPESPNGRHRARPIVLIVERDPATAICHEGMIIAGGCSAMSFADYLSADNWLSTNSPDAAVIDVEPGDRACAGFARKLSQREIPLLAISDHSADVR